MRRTNEKPLSNSLPVRNILGIGTADDGIFEQVRRFLRFERSGRYYTIAYFRYFRLIKRRV
jgi:hypothetical protein